MSRRIVWLVLGVAVLAVTGFLFAVLAPRSSDELPPPAVIIDKTITIPPGEPKNAVRIFSASEVRREFRNSGLPLRELPNPGPPPRVFTSPKVPIFNVSIYETPTAAAAAVAGGIFVLRPVGYRTHGQLMTRRRANVVVVFEDGRPVVRRRLMSALARLN